MAKRAGLKAKFYIFTSDRRRRRHFKDYSSDFYFFRLHELPKKGIGLVIIIYYETTIVIVRFLYSLFFTGSIKLVARAAATAYALE